MGKRLKSKRFNLRLQTEKRKQLLSHGGKA